MYHPFTIRETIKKAWDVIKKNYIILIVFTTITFLGEILKDNISLYFSSENYLTQVAVTQLISLIAAYLTLSFYRLLLTLIDREYYEFEFRDIIPSFKMVLNAVIIGIALNVVIRTVIFIDFRLIKNVYLLQTLLVLEVVAAAYLGIRLIFCLCFIVDDDSGPVESLVQSFKVTRGNFFKLLAMVLLVFVFVALILLIINGIITLFVDQYSPLQIYFIEFAAIFWFAITFPAVQVIIITTYRKLIYSHQDVDDDVSETL
ncbi:glycerophosphoryl diester phosphodiesterase membrane domain-containing protein [Mucilaginibacter sp.]